MRQDLQQQVISLYSPGLWPKAFFLMKHLMYQFNHTSSGVDFWRAGCQLIE